MTDTNLITVAEFSLYAPEVDVSKYDDPTMSGMIAQASKIATDYLQYTPLQETITGELKQAQITSEGDLLIFPNKPPVQSVSRIAIRKGATTVELALLDSDNVTKYNIDFTQRNIRFPAGEMTLQGTPIFTDFYALRGSQFYSVLDYVGGWLQSDLPDSIKHAVVLIMREMISRSQNTSGANKISQGGISLEFSDRKDGESDLIKDAKRYLAPYRRIG